MATIAELIELARSTSGANQAEIASRLGRSRQTITNWKSGERVPEDDAVIALARLAGEDPDGWLAIAQAARTEGTPRKHWEAIARRLGIAASVALCAIGTAIPLNLQAAVPDSVSYVNTGLIPAISQRGAP